VAFLRSSCAQPPLLVRSHNDILARDRSINHRFTCREEGHEAVVEYACGDEGVDVSDCETANGISLMIGECEGSKSAQGWKGVVVKSLQVLAALRHRNGGLNILDEAGKWWGKADDEGSDGAPVSAVFAITIDAVEVVEVGYTDTTAADDVVICDQDCCHRTKEDGVACDESDQCLC